MTTFRRAWTMQLREGAEAAYDAAHASMWPEMRDQMRANGIVRFYLYRSGQTIFAFQERDRPFGPNNVPPSELTARWWRDMAPLMETDGKYHHPVQHEMREVFTFETIREVKS